MKLVGYCFLAAAVWFYIVALIWVETESSTMVYLYSEKDRLTRYKKIWKVTFVLRAGMSTVLGVLMARIIDVLFF